MKFGARNKLEGKVVAIDKGGIMAQVKVEIPAASQMSSVMTIESLDELDLKEGDRITVVAKAVNVLLIKE